MPSDLEGSGHGTFKTLCHISYTHRAFTMTVTSPLISCLCGASSEEPCATSAGVDVSAPRSRAYFSSRFVAYFFLNTTIHGLQFVLVYSVFQKLLSPLVLLLLRLVNPQQFLRLKRDLRVSNILYSRGRQRQARGQNPARQNRIFGPPRGF